MADARKTLEILLRGRDETRGAYRSGVAGARTFADQTIGHVGRISRSVLNLQNVIAGAAVTMAAKSVFEPAIDMERAETEFGVLLRSTDDAKQHMQDLANFAASTPLLFGDLRSGSKLLLGVGEAAENVIPTLRMLGDVAGGDSERLARLSNAYAKVRTKGKATMEELNLFLEAGVPILDELGKQAGATGQDLAKMIAAGAIGFDDVRDALEALTSAGGIYEGMMDKISAKTSGRVSTMRDVWEAVRRDVGEEALPALSEAVEDLLGTLQGLRESGQLQQWGEGLGTTIEELMARLKGISAWVADNKTELKLMGFSYALIRFLAGTAAALRAVNATIAALTVGKKVETLATEENTAATVANTAAKNANAAASKAQAAAAVTLREAFSTAAGALSSLAAIGVTAFAGWKIGEFISEVTGIRLAFERLGEAMASAQQKGEIEIFQDQWAERFKDRGGVDARDDRGRSMSEAWQELEGKKRRREAEAAEIAKVEKQYRGAIEKLERLRQDAIESAKSGQGNGVETWQAVTGLDSLDKLDTSQLADTESDLRKLLKRFEDLSGEKNVDMGLRIAIRKAQGRDPESASAEADAKAEQKTRERVAQALQKAAEQEIKRRQEIAERIEKANDDSAEARAKAGEDRQREELQGIADDVRERIQAAERAAREEERRAGQLEQDAEEAWERFLLPKDERKRQEKDVEDRAKLEAKLQRRIERGRQRLAEGGRIRTETRELIEIDDQRKEAATARAQAQEKRDFAEASRARLADVQAQLADLTATQISSEEELTKALRDLEAELRSGAKGDLGGRDLGQMSADDLQRVAEHGRKITEGTDEAKGARAAEGDLVAAALGEVEIRTKQAAEGEQPEAKPDQERTVTTSAITEGEQPEAKPDEERKLTTSQVTEGEQPAADPNEERTVTTHQVVTGVQPHALPDEERTIETRERVTREIVVTDPGTETPAPQTIKRDIAVTDQGVLTPQDQVIGRKVETEDAGATFEADQIVTREIVVTDPGTKTPAPQTIKRDIDVTDQGVRTPQEQTIGRKVETTDAGASIEADQIVTREIVVTDPGAKTPADETVKRDVDVTDQGVRTPQDQVVKRSVAADGQEPEPAADQTVGVNYLVDTPAEEPADLVQQANDSLNESAKLWGQDEEPRETLPRPDPAEAAAQNLPAKPAEKKEGDRPPPRPGVSVAHAMDVGNDFDRRFGERANERNDERMGQLGERMDAGAFLPRELEAQVKAWREGQKPEVAAGPQPAAVVPPVMPAPVMPRAAGAVAQVPGREMLAELRQIKSWLQHAKLGIS